MSARVRRRSSAGPAVIQAASFIGALSLGGCAADVAAIPPEAVETCERSPAQCLGALAGSYAGSLGPAGEGEFRLLLQSDGVIQGSLTRRGSTESLRGQFEHSGLLEVSGSIGAELAGSVSGAGDISGTYEMAPRAAGEFSAQRVGPAFPPESGRQRGDGGRCERLARLSFECATDLSVEYCTEPEGIDVCYAECLLASTCEELSDPEGSLGQLICYAVCDSRTQAP